MKEENKTNLTSNKIEDTKELQIKDTKEIIKKTPKLYNEVNLKELSLNHYEYMLPTDNFLKINLKDNYLKDIRYVEFDENQLEGRFNEETNVIELKSTYEIVPGKNKLVIFYNDNTTVEIKLDIKYLYDIEKNQKDVFLENWIFHKTSTYPAYGIRNAGEVILGGKCDKKNIIMEYEKNFDRDINIIFDFMPLKTKTVDMRLSFGERIVINFDIM